MNLRLYHLDDEPSFTKHVARWTKEYNSSSEKRKGVEINCETCNDLETGQKAVLKKLRSCPEDTAAVILLDWDWDGDPDLAIRFMRAMKADEGLRKWPIIVYSTSSEQDDINESYSNLASAFFCKGSVSTRRGRFFNLLDSWCKEFSLPQAESAANL